MAIKKVNLIFFILLLIITSLANAELVEKTLAIVNNEVILLSDLQKLLNKLEKGNLVDDLIFFENSSEAIKKDPKLQLNYLINEKLLDSEIKRQNLSVTMEKVDQEMREIGKKNKLSKEELLSAVKQQGIDPAEYQNFIKARIEHQSLVEQEITSKIRISDEDVLAFYLSESNSSYKQVYEFGISHIFFSPKSDNPEKAYQRALNVESELIKTNPKFEDLVAKYSDDKSTTDGFLGLFKTGEFTKEFELAVRDIQVGDHSKVIKSKTGFHILKLNSKKIVPDPNFEKIKESLKAQLFDKIFKRQFKNWLEVKKEESFIRINQ
jgi:peptidyl-prolyl cis-trans isomerase SurA